MAKRVQGHGEATKLYKKRTKTTPSATRKPTGIHHNPRRSLRIQEKQKPATQPFLLGDILAAEASASLYGADPSEQAWFWNQVRKSTIVRIESVDPDSLHQPFRHVSRRLLSTLVAVQGSSTTSQVNQITGLGDWQCEIRFEHLARDGEDGVLWVVPNVEKAESRGLGWGWPWSESRSAERRGVVEWQGPMVSPTSRWK